MNLKEKERLKEKCEALEALISCIDQSWLYEHTEMNLNQTAIVLSSSLLITTNGDRELALNALLRMVNILLHQIKQETL